MTLRQSFFQVREMLLDYQENKLDSARQDLVKNTLANDAETQHVLKQLNSGLNFAKQISHVEIKEGLRQQLIQSENLSSLFFHYCSFKNWNQAFRASTYALMSCIFVLVLVMSLPRNILLRLKPRSNQEVVLSQILKPPEASIESDDPEKRDAQTALAQNLPTDTDEEESIPSDGQEASGDEHAEPFFIPPSTTALTLNTRPPSTKTVAQAEQKSPETKGDSKNEVSGDSSESNNTDISRKPSGIVLRGAMKIDELDEKTPLIAQQILELGGRKAGEVELGWRKDNKGSYYHFSLPEENYDKLLEYLQGLGPVRFSKDSHPRVMPQGQLRFILWVERKNE